MVRIFLSIGAFAALAACQPAVPDSGVGFDNSITAQRQREAALSGQPVVVQPPQQSAAPVVVQTPPADPAAQPLPPSVTTAVNGTTRTQEQAANDAIAAANSGVSPVNASPSNPAPVQLDNPGISSEQDFSTVSSQRSRQSDADRIASNRAQYTIIQPEALPKRPGTNQPNIVAYALQTKHPVGAQLHRRTALSSQGRFVRNCAKYPSPDQAQIAFLMAGGPDRDRKGLDPDGDGFACSWDPTPFRKASQPATPAPVPAELASE